jgi:hypothetical protein
MNLNRLQAITEIPLDVENDGAWIEVLMGQGEVLASPPATLAVATREVYRESDREREREREKERTRERENERKREGSYIDSYRGYI